MKLTEFAKRLNTSPRNIYDIFERSEIKTDQLKRICEVLKFNFFALYEVQDVEEPTEAYLRARKKCVAIVVELDGDDSTLTAWISRLTIINKAMA